MAAVVEEDAAATAAAVVAAVADATRSLSHELWESNLQATGENFGRLLD